MNKKLFTFINFVVVVCFCACGKTPATETALLSNQTSETEISSHPLETKLPTQPVEDERNIYEDDFIKIRFLDMSIDDTLGGSTKTICEVENKSDAEIGGWIENICANGDPTQYIADSFSLNSGETCNFSFMFLNSNLGIKRVSDIDEVRFMLQIDSDDYTLLDEVEVIIPCK